MNQPTLAELKAELEQLSKKIAELEKQPEMTAKERWKEERDNENEKMTYKITLDIDFYDENHAKLWVEQTNLMEELQIFAKLRNGDWVAKTSRKYGILLDARGLIAGYLASANYFVYGISFKSKEIAEEALEIFGERIEQYYGK